MRRRSNRISEEEAGQAETPALAVADGASAALAGEVVSDAAAVRTVYRRLVAAAVATFAAQLRQGEIVVSSVGDLERLVKLDLMLMGDAAPLQADPLEEVLGIDRMDEAGLRARLEECLAALAAGGVSPVAGAVCAAGAPCAVVAEAE